jgi:hypothetical protein
MVKVRIYPTCTLLISYHPYRRLVDGEWTDDDIHDPISNMVTLLNEKRDRALTQKWGIWLTKRDPERGLKVNPSLTIVFSDLNEFYFVTSY